MYFNKTDNNWYRVSYKKQNKRPRKYYIPKSRLNSEPKIEFDKDLDYLVHTRNLVVSMIESVLKGE